MAKSENVSKKAASALESTNAASTRRSKSVAASALTLAKGDPLSRARADYLLSGKLLQKRMEAVIERRAKGWRMSTG